MDDTTPPAPLRPIARAERIDLLDVLRGFALGGIVIYNYQVLSGLTFLSPVELARVNPSVVDRAARFLVHVFVDEKFYSLFSLLFGIGFSILIRRSAERSAAFAPLFRRRLEILLGFGFVHAILIWFGDILVLYALLGFFLLAFRERSDRTVLRWSMALLASPVVVYVAYLAVGMPDPLGSPGGDSGPSFLGRLLTALREGGYADVVAANAVFYAGAWIRYVVYIRIPKVLGMFLLGVWLDRRDVFRDVETHRRLLTRTARWGLAIGLPANTAVAVLIGRHVFLPASPLGFLQTALATVGVPALALGYAASIALLLGRPGWRTALMALAPMGRMALTHYLLQSVIGVAVFYGIGLGLFGQIPPLAVHGIAMAVFLTQVLASVPWMARFAYGPTEWLWRRLTYRQPLVLRRASGPVAP